ISRKKRILLILSPIVLLVFTFLYISPQIGFTLFPAADNAVITGTIEAQE
ncbi:hypothetical protein HOA93_06705, partial [bacterium]|nr:hypothetical protein [bacterium]